MCVGPLKPSRPKPPPPPPPSPEVEEAKKRETTKRKERVEETAVQKARRIKGGTGRRSLISGSGGGMGFYNEYM